MGWLIDYVGVLLAGLGGVVGSSAYCRIVLRPRWEREAIRKWYPPAGFGDDILVNIEELDDLRKRRELHDNGRVYPARSDAGRPARTHRMRVRSRRSTRQRPN